MKTTQSTIRPMGAEDLDRVIALDEHAGGLRREDFFNRRRQAMDRNPQSYFGLVSDGEDGVNGFVLGHVLTGEFGATRPLAVIDSIAVDPGRRGGGIGTALMQALKHAAGERGCAEIRTLADWSRQDLLGFFHATGFSPAPLNVLEKNLDTD